MKKRVWCLLLALLLLLGMGTGATAANDAVSVEIDGEAVAFSADSGYPYVDENGRTQVPLRAVMEQFGCTVTWDEASKAAVIESGDTTVVVPIGQSYLLVNGKTVPMDTAAVAKDGHTYLPIRPVLEAFGAQVRWSDGAISVAKPETGAAFENIYVDEDGNLIFKLANGNEINAGAISAQDGRDGRDGRDGVSVTDVYVDADSNLMVTLSSGRTINAGNIGTGGSMESLTFADYDVGTKFYLTAPAGAFDVPVQKDGVKYIVHLDSVYYELTEKYAYGDAAAWWYTDGETFFVPYQVTVHISGSTDPALAGSSLGFSFSEGNSIDWGYGGNHSRCVVASDGSFATEVVQGGDNSILWYGPKQLYLKSVSIEDITPEPPELTQEEIIELVQGTWSYSPSVSFTVQPDGTITFNGETYSPVYQQYYDSRIRAYDDATGVRFYFYDVGTKEEYADYSGDSDFQTYYRGRTWTAVPLTMENFFDYFEYAEIEDVHRDPIWNKVDRVHYSYRYVPKAEYQGKLDGTIDIDPSGVRTSIAYNYQSYLAAFTVDKETGKVTIEPTEKGRAESKKATLFGNSDECYFEVYRADFYVNDSSTIVPKDFKITDVAGTLYFIND